jgi:uncharacterized membrane protein YjjP (DUF1212 family)
MLRKISRKIDRFLLRRGIDNPEVRWLVGFQVAVVAAGALGLCGTGLFSRLPAFLTGAVLATINFYVLAKMVPVLIFQRKGSVAALLFSFYFRLGLTAVVLVLAVAWARFSVVTLLAGLSTVLVTIAVWGGKFIVTQKHKEA